MTGLMQRTLTECGALCIYKHATSSMSEIGLVALCMLNGIYFIIPAED